MPSSVYFELPDASVMGFNANYDHAAAIAQSSSLEAFDRTVDEVVDDMANELWGVCQFLLRGSPSQEKLFAELMRVFKESHTLDLSSWSPLHLKVRPPNSATKRLHHELGHDISVFQMGYLILEIAGNPKVKIGNKEQHLVNRLTSLYAIVDV